MPKTKRRGKGKLVMMDNQEHQGQGTYGKDAVQSGAWSSGVTGPLWNGESSLSIVREKAWAEQGSSWCGDTSVVSG